MDARLAWVLWSVPVFLALTRVARPPRTAMPHHEQAIRGMAPVAVSLLTVTLASLLGWLLLVRLNPATSCNLAQWFQGPGILLLLAAMGVWLLPIAFRATDCMAAFSLDSATRFIMGLAWAACWPATWESARGGNPGLFLVAGACSLLPDSLDEWIARWLHRTDIHIVPDPLTPDPGVIAGAVSLAIARCQEQRKAIGLQVYPGQTREGVWHAYSIRLDNHNRQLVASHGDTSVAAPLPCAITTDLPFTLETGTGVLSLKLAPMQDGRVRLLVNPGQRTWSHSLAMAAGLGLAAGLAAGPVAGIIAAGACALHLIVDQLGFTGLAWLYPFRRETGPGVQLLRPAHQKAFSIGVVCLAFLLITWKGAGSGS